MKPRLGMGAVSGKEAAVWLVVGIAAGAALLLVGGGHERKRDRRFDPYAWREWERVDAEMKGKHAEEPTRVDRRR